MDYPSTPAVVSAQPRHRYALLFGNAEYNRNKKIRSCLHDVDLLRDTLERSLAPEDRFTVYSYKDLTSCEMGVLMKEFCDNLCKMHEPDVTGQRDIAVLFHYSGHGITIGGASYLVPVDDYSAHNQWLNARTILNELRRVRAKVSFLTLDCCRTAAMDISSMSNCVSADNLFLVFSTTPGMVASSPNQNGPGYFTKALCNRMLAPKNVGRHYSEMFRSVESEVIEVTKKRQRPSCSGCLSTEFCFVTRSPCQRPQLSSPYQHPSTVPGPTIALPLPLPCSSMNPIATPGPQVQIPPQWRLNNNATPAAKASVEILAQLFMAANKLPAPEIASGTKKTSTTATTSAMTTSSTTKKRSKSGNPDKKRCKRGYDIFRSEWFATNKERLGLQGAVGTAERKAGEAWRAMPREEREKYIAKARTDESPVSIANAECPRGEFPSTSPSTTVTSTSTTTTTETANNEGPITDTKKRKLEASPVVANGESKYAQLLGAAEGHISSLLELIPLLETCKVEGSEQRDLASLFQPLIARVQQIAKGHEPETTTSMATSSSTNEEEEEGVPQPSTPTTARVMDECALPTTSLKMLMMEKSVLGEETASSSGIIADQTDFCFLFE